MDKVILGIVQTWVSRLNTRGVYFNDSPNNGPFMLNVINTRFGGNFSIANLDAALEFCGAEMFQPGYEPPTVLAKARTAEADSRVAAAEKETAEAKQRLEKLEKEEQERKRQQNPVFRDPRRDARTTEKDREAAEAARVAEANDVNSESFKKIQAYAKQQFENLCNTYCLTRANGRMDHTTTQERREGLRGIKAVANQKDKEGKPVLVYSKMLEIAREMLNGFEREDEKIRW